MKESLNKDYYAMTDAVIAGELGRRLEQIRLEHNVPQKVLTDELGISEGTYRSAVKGKVRLEILVGILRVLGKLENLDNFLPETPFSPLELLKLEGKKRQRAGTKRGRSKASDMLVNSQTSESSEQESLDW